MWQESQEELKKLQSLGAFHDFIKEHNKSYSSRQEYKHRYGVFKQNMKKVQFLRESEQGTGNDQSEHRLTTVGQSEVNVFIL